MNITRSLLLAAIIAAAASASAQTDMTSRLANPDFESAALSWTHYGLQTQNNVAFGLKSGNIYMERWIERGKHVGSAYAAQTLTSLPVGVYELSAVAQNIQENTPTAAQTGAYIFAGTERVAVTTAATYTVRFTVAATTAETPVGFLADGATGNYIAFDNFRLTQVATGLAKVKAELLSLLQATIDASRATMQAGSAAGRTDYAAAIEAAEAVAAATSTSAANLSAAIAALRRADTVYAYASPSGTTPTVTTNPLFTRGADVAFARATFSGSNIVERGFCWSTSSPEPTVVDARSTVTLSYNGDVYVMPGLQPSTAYYARPYAITSGRRVAYGKALKIVTIPRGNITYLYNNGASADANTRINNALAEAVYYWNHLTSITGFGISCSYGAQTPTADCSYGGSMRIGPSESYQRTGTVMHEMLHGIGVGTHSLWWNGEMRSNGDRGDWLGTRATEVIRFWDNNATEVLTGDNTHLWPYGINGAHEDTGSPILYTITSLIAQALGEDGLPPSSGAFATPAYVLAQDDAVKCYIKVEDEALGGLTSYLREGRNMTLTQQAMDSSAAEDNDSTAWFVTFDPASRTYRFRNAATGHYIAYNASYSTFRATTSLSGLQLMRGRSLITVGSDKVYSYHFLRPSSGSSPAALTATSATTVGSAAYDLAASASAQRWLVLSPKQAKAFDEAYRKTALTAFTAMAAFARSLLTTPHEQLYTADAPLAAAIDDYTASAATATGSAIDALTTRLRADALTFLSRVRPTEGAAFNLTPLIANPTFDTSTTGWQGSTPALGAGCAEFYQTTFDMYQLLADMPAGRYTLGVQAFQRLGSAADSYAAFTSGTPTVSTQLYAASASTPVANIAADRQSAALYTTDGWGGDVQTPDNAYVPNSMTGAARYFDKELYHTTLDVTLDATTDLRLGLRSTRSETLYWSIFDNFTLLYHGSDVAVGLADATPDADPLASDLNPTAPAAFTISGQQLRSTQPLRRGIYIVRGRKVAVH